jgi:hypothetical protein
MLLKILLFTYDIWPHPEKNSKPNLSQYAHYENEHASDFQSEPLNFVPESTQLLLHQKHL